MAAPGQLAGLTSAQGGPGIGHVFRVGSLHESWHLLVTPSVAQKKWRGAPMA